MHGGMCMIHIMKINDNAFERMKKGIKKREYRVNDEKRKLVRVGDIIEFQKISNQEEKIHNKLSKLVDMRLEDSIDKNTYLTKENELKTELKDIETKRNELIEIKNQNKTITLLQILILSFLF